MAAQLRKPTGLLSRTISSRMNAVNRELYGLVFQQLDLLPHTHVLELGPGNGRTSVPLFHLQPTLRYAALDYSADMVAATRRTLAKPIAQGLAEVHQGSSDAMPFADREFDVVFGVNTIYFWDDPSAHLQEVRRVLKPGGRLVTGYRDAASMKDLPFTKHGFAMYGVEAWEQLLRDHGAVTVQSQVRQEPERKWQGQRLYVKGCCTVAQW